MRKTILIVIVALVSAAMASAQPRAIGGRVGYNIDFVYQHSLSEKTFIELNAGALEWWKGTHVDFLHEWIWLTPNWTPKGEWNWFAGVGANVGWKWNDDHIVYNYSSSSVSVNTNYTGYTDDNGNYHRAQAFMVGAIGNIGLEYTFWFPLSLSFDFRPTLGVMMGKNAGDVVDNKGNILPVRFYLDGLFDGAVSVRYRF